MVNSANTGRRPDPASIFTGCLLDRGFRRDALIAVAMLLIAATACVWILASAGYALPLGGAAAAGLGIVARRRRRS